MKKKTVHPTFSGTVTVILLNLASRVFISKMPRSLVYFLFAQKCKETFRGKKGNSEYLKQVS